jgi:hypothetical protein
MTRKSYGLKKTVQTKSHRVDAVGCWIMGTTFVSLSPESSAGEVGFWMQDSVLELWLRLLALHLPEDPEPGPLAHRLRDQWLLASRGYFNGWVPHCLDEFASSEQGIRLIRQTIQSLMTRLNEASDSLDHDTLNLLGIEGLFTAEIATAKLEEVGKAFIDLLDGRITSTVESTAFMPGS